MELEPQVQAHRKVWQDAFDDKRLKLEVRLATAIWDANSVSSLDRELPLNFLLAISDEVDGNNRPKSAFVGSALWRRRALPRLVVPLLRSEYRDWDRQVHVFDGGNLDISAERRQASSGVPLYTALLREAVHGLNLSENHSCHVRDYSQVLSVSVSTSEAISRNCKCSRFCLSKRNHPRLGRPHLGHGSGGHQWDWMQPGHALHGLRGLHVAQLHDSGHGQDRGSQHCVRTKDCFQSGPGPTLEDHDAKALQWAAS